MTDSNWTLGRLKTPDTTAVASTETDSLDPHEAERELRGEPPTTARTETRVRGDAR